MNWYISYNCTLASHPLPFGRISPFLYHKIRPIPFRLIQLIYRYGALPNTLACPSLCLKRLSECVGACVCMWREGWLHLRGYSIQGKSGGGEHLIIQGYRVVGSRPLRWVLSAPMPHFNATETLGRSDTLHRKKHWNPSTPSTQASQGLEVSY